MVEYLDQSGPITCPLVLCLGFFDGVHKGHQALLGQARLVAEAEGLEVCVHTFDKSPALYFTKDTKAREITPLEKKAKLLAYYGAMRVLVTRFDETVSKTPGRTFLVDALLKKANIKHLVVGYDHRFGSHQDVDTNALKTICEELQISLSVVAAVRLPDGSVVSSTALRQALAAGDHQRVMALTGRSLQLERQILVEALSDTKQLTVDGTEDT